MKILSTQTKSDFIPTNASKCVIDVLLNDELELTKNDIKRIFEHYKLEDIEQICLDLLNSWDSSKLISKVGFLRGKLKQLNKRKTENNSFDFSNLFDEKEDLQDNYISELIECSSVVLIKHYDEFKEFLQFVDIAQEDKGKLKEMHKNNELNFEEIEKQKMIEFRKKYSK